MFHEPDGEENDSGQAGKRLPYGILRPMASPNRSLLVDLAIIGALALIAVVGYRYSPLLLPKADLTLTPPATCDLNRAACAVDVPGGGRIELALAPHPVPVVRPVQVAASFSGIMPGKVEIDFEGVQMNMGYNRVALAATDAGHFGGEATIPVCVTGRMQWRATLMVETDRQRIAVPFLFEAPVDGT
jgi:hypothetical protein